MLPCARRPARGNLLGCRTCASSHVLALRVSLTRKTVALGRELIGLSASAHVSYPDGTPTVVVLVHNLSGNLQELARRHVTDVLGDFDETVE